jgi:peptidoglycan/LPS O-acetylase OafA/YrhL
MPIEINHQTEALIQAPGVLKHKPFMSYRPELDGLRAVAVLAVIFYHAGFSFCRGGYVGVDIFFVLSGYLMTSIILKETENNEFTLIRFYVRRVRRILPMLYFTISISYIPAYKYLFDKEFVHFTKSAFLASVGLSNFFFATTTNGYFDTKTDLLPLVHTWTLGVEEQFYVIIPLLFILFRKLDRMAIMSSIVTLALASFYLTFVNTNSIHKFYMLHTRFWELAIGSLIVFMPKQSKSNVVSLVGFASILAAILVYNESMPNPSYFTLLPTLGTALVIIYTNIDTILGKVLSQKPFVWIGLISYSAYLIHQPMFAFARVLNLSSIDNFKYSLMIFAIFGLSYLTWRFVENPFRNRDQFSMKLISAFILIYFIALKLDSIFLLTTESDPISNTCQSVEVILKNNSLVINSSVIYKTMPSANLFRYGVGSQIGRRCFMHHFGGEKTQPQMCRIGLDQTSPPVYFLFGDSFSLVMAGAFKDIQKPGMFAAFNGDACAPLLRANLSIRHPSSYYSSKFDSEQKRINKFIKFILFKQRISL